MTEPANRDAGAWDRIRGIVCGLAGWRRRGFTFFLGVLATAALPPVHAVPVLVVSFTGLVWLSDASRSKIGAFGCGWWFGLGYFAAGLYWVSFAFLVEAAKFGWMIPFAIAGLAAVLAVYCGAAVLATRLSGCTGPGRVLVLAASWTSLEWLRGIAFTGFPWNPLATVWTPWDAMVQIASVTGVFGLSLVTVIAAAAPAAVSGRAGAGRWLPLGFAGALIVAVWAGGAWRLAGAGIASVPGVMLRIVQPNIDQKLKWRRDLRDGHFARYLELSRTGNGVAGKTTDRITHVIWPETAATFVVANDAAKRRIMAAAAPAGGLLLTGSVRTTPRGTERFKAWNSLHAIDPGGKIVATYDKFHLVPFGEYVPLRSILKLTKLTAGRSDFSFGHGPRTLALDGLPPVSPLICYEAIFPGQVVDPNARPEWLLNVTNDAWFGLSSGPYQHFAAARFRAVEEGLPLVRAANTGISAIVDAYGRITAYLGLGRLGVLDGRLPRAIAAPPFARFGNWVLLIVICCVAALGFVWRDRT